MRQLVLAAPEHVRHDEWHAVQLPESPTTSAKVSLGHSAMHSPLRRKGVDGLVQLRHSVLAGPLQVPHAASHGSHTLFVSAHLPAGVQDARHEPGGSEKGVAAAQLV